MRLRHLVLVAGAGSVAAVFAITAAAVYVVTSTSFGHGWVRETLVAQIGPGVKGKLYVGKISGTLLGDVTIDSIDLRDRLDSVFVTSGPIHFTFEPRDLIDRRIVLRTLEITRPLIRLKEHTDGEWNWRHIFPRGKSRPRLTPKGREFGDYVAIDTLTIHDGTVLVVQPWHPDDSLHGARRDSAIRVTLAAKAGEVRPDSEGYMRTMRWTALNGALGRTRLADPDSVGERFTLRKVDVIEHDPPFHITNASGIVRKNDDSVWIELDHFELPHTVAKGRGKIWWGRGLPMRWDITTESDSAGLADFAWITDVIPPTGRGRVKVAIHNQRGNLRVMEYALTGLDVRSKRSHLRGTMTFAVGGPVLGMSDVALALEPVNFDLLRHFNGRPFPYDWQGTVTGTLRASGGPVNAFKVERADMVFADANVPGAVSRLVGSGEIDILRPGATKFRGFDVVADRLDLRTFQFLNADFPRLNGVVRGKTRLDSVWYDVRFSRADMQHIDGTGEPTRGQGSGRVTLGDSSITYDLDLTLAPLSLTTLARSYPSIPGRGVMTGPMTVKGTVGALQVVTRLGGTAGTLDFAGTVDLDPPGYSLRGTGTFEQFDLRALTERRTLPTTALNGSYRADIAGDSIGNLRGSASADVGRSLVDSIRLYTGVFRATFADGRLHVDTARFETSAATVAVSGGLGLPGGDADTLHVVAIVDSLGGLRRYLNAPLALAGGMSAEAGSDSLAGTLNLDLRLTGRLDSLAAAGSLDGQRPLWHANAARSIHARFAVADVLTGSGATVHVVVDTANYGALRLLHADFDAHYRDSTWTDVALSARSATGTTAGIAGRVETHGDTTAYVVDSATVVTGDNRWQLTNAARVTDAPGTLTVEAIRLRGVRRGWIAIGGSMPREGPGVDVRITGDSIPLVNLTQLAQLGTRIAGEAKLDWRIAGSRAAPTMTIDATVRGAALGEGKLRSIGARGTYAAQRLALSVDVLSRDTAVLAATAVLPVDLALVVVDQRLLDWPLEGRISAANTDLALVESFTTALDSTSGRMDIDLSLAGTWRKPLINGGAHVIGGAARLSWLGRVALTHINGDLLLRGDSLDIPRLEAQSTQARIGRRIGTMNLTGGIGFADAENPMLGLHLTSSGFNVIDRPGLADIDLSADLHLTGRYDAAELRGHATVDRGAIYIRDLAQKRVISLDNPDLYRVVDTAVFAEPLVVANAPSRFINNLTLRDVRIDMGQDVRLLSSESKITIGGSVLVGRRRTLRGLDSSQVQLTLDGQLLVNRGTYTLNIGDVVRRTFDVERGSMRFYNDDVAINPALDITAIYTVRKFNSTVAQQDRRIRVKIGGTLNQPLIDFESADDARLSQSDLISYLVTGGPSFGVGDATQGTGPGGVAANTLINTVGSALGDKLAGLGVLDVVQIQTAGLDRSAQQNSNSDAGSQLIAGTRIGGGIQFGERTYLSANVGLCPLAPQTNTKALTLQDLLGLKVEYKMSRVYGLSVGLEPSSAGLTCGGILRGTANTPPQIGFDFTGLWRF